MDDMFKTTTVFDANKLTIYGAYMISFSMDSTNTDDINHIFREYLMHTRCSGMNDNASCLPENRIRGCINRDWYDVEAILVGIHPKELMFLVPYFAEIKTNDNDAWCNMPILKIPIEACMDDELRGAPVRIHRMGIKNVYGDWVAPTKQ